MASQSVFDEGLLQLVEDQLKATLSSTEEKVAGIGHIFDAMRYSALAGGKRFRPLLTIHSADLFDVDRAYSVRAGSAIELIHCYSLIHDDLPAMDDSNLRRGRPTSHIQYDEATAILAGDALLTESFHQLSLGETHPDPAVRIKLVRELSHAAGTLGMVGGQMIDILAEKGIAEADDIELLQALKTGALIRVSCRFGGILAEAADEHITRLDRYASDVGLAFQITDDLLDVVGDAEETGKQVGIDAINEKPTFVELLGEEGARTKARELVEDAKAQLVPYGAKALHLENIADFLLSRRS